MFLGLAPYETEFINPSTLTKFRRNKIKLDELLNVLIQMTLDVVFEKKEPLDKMELPENIQLGKDRYKVEAKFDVLKKTLSYQDARYSGISVMTIQTGASIFTSNMNRIMKLEEEK